MNKIRTLNSQGIERTEIVDDDIVDAIFHQELKSYSSTYIYPSYDELLAAFQSENTNKTNEDGEKIGIWMERSERSLDGSFRFVSYSLDVNKRSNIEWIAYMNGDAEMQRISARNGFGNIQLLEAHAYYRLYGIDMIED